MQFGRKCFSRSEGGTDGCWIDKSTILGKITELSKMLLDDIARRLRNNQLDRSCGNTTSSIETLSNKSRNDIIIQFSDKILSLRLIK